MSTIVVQNSNTEVPELSSLGDGDGFARPRWRRAPSTRLLEFSHGHSSVRRTMPPDRLAPTTCAPRPAARGVGHSLCARQLDVVTSASPKDRSPSQKIDERIKELGDWRGETLSRIRAIVKEANPSVVEEWKWRGVPVCYHDGMMRTGEKYQSVVKVTFAKGASLKDPSGLFNSSLDGNVRRAIDLHTGDTINERALTALLRAAVTLNTSHRTQCRGPVAPPHVVPPRDRVADDVAMPPLTTRGHSWHSPIRRSDSRRRQVGARDQGQPRPPRTLRGETLSSVVQTERSRAASR